MDKALNLSSWTDPQPVSIILASILVETLLYGAHVILFVICIYFLAVRQMRLLWIMLVGTVVMFLLATGDVALSLNALFKGTRVSMFVGGRSFDMLERLTPKFVIFVTNNFIAVSLLIARFYVVWGQKKYLLVISFLSLLVVTAYGYTIPSGLIKTKQQLRQVMPAYFLGTMTLNSALTLLTGGRIWWISRSIASTRGSRRQYQVTSAILVESGMLHSLSMVVTMVLSVTPWTLIGGVIMLRMVCIAPVLMTVQIAIAAKRSVSLQQKTTTDGPAQIATDRLVSVPPSVMLDTILRTRYYEENSARDVTSHAPARTCQSIGLQLHRRTSQNLS